MKEFEFFLQKGDVRKQKPDLNLSGATLREGVERLQFATGLKAKPKYILENAYEAMREAADALLYHDGYKSYSHEASIIYCAQKGFNELDLRQFDRFRKIRNGIKYYGKDCSHTDAEAALKLAEKIVDKIQEMLHKKEEVTVLEWNTSEKVILIHSLEELFEALTNMSPKLAEDIIPKNKVATERWIKKNFLKKTALIKIFEEDYDLQQWRENLIKKLRQVA